MFTRFQAVLLLIACMLCACAADERMSEQKLLTMPEDAEAAAQDILADTLAFHTAAHATYSRVKGELETDRFALIDALRREPWKDSSLGLWGISGVRDELSELLGATDWEQRHLHAAAYSVLFEFSPLLTAPRDDKTERWLDLFMDASADAYWDIAALLTSSGRPELESAYYFAPTFNIIASVRIIALAMQGYGADRLDEVYMQTIAVNTHLVGTGTGEDDDPGTLSDYIASRYAGSASAREKNEADPVAYCIRRMLEEQQAALRGAHDE